jgi:hypothetical protein
MMSKTVMSKKTLNQTNLEALGAEQLATLLMEISAGSADIKRRLRFELSYNLGPEDLAHEIRKRLASLRKSKTFIGWRKRKAMVKDLNTQAVMITDKIGPQDPTLAFDLLWQFIEMAPDIYLRVDDKKSEIRGVFDTALQGFEGIAPRAILDVKTLADRVFLALRDNEYGQWNDIITLAAPALGPSGLADLRAKIEAYADAPNALASDDHEAIQFLRQLRGGANYVAERKARFVKSCLQEIAALTGDTGSYIDQFSKADLRRNDLAAEVAMLMLADDRFDDALEVLLNADQDTTVQGQQAWDAAYIACLLGLGRTEEAQAHRWDSFSETLNGDLLCSYLKLLPDFEDVEVEERAMAMALAFPDFTTALAFCLSWPDLLTAAQLVETRHNESEHLPLSLLSQALEALRLRHPLIAVLMLRAKIDSILGRGQPAFYDQGAGFLMDCAALDAEIPDYRGFGTHDEYLLSLRTEHERKSSFLAKIKG